MEGSRAKILVVDDIEINRVILNEMLKDKYEIEEAENGKVAIAKLLNAIHKPSLILLDVMMPEMDGFTTLQVIKSNPQLAKIPVIFITAAADEEQRGLTAGAVDYVVKPFKSEIVLLRVGTHIELTQYREKLENLVEQKSNEIVSTKETFLETMANLIEYRSAESGQHVKRTKDLCSLLVLQLLKKGPYVNELKNTNCGALVKAVPLHDIGKIAIPDNILLKPGKLTPEEFSVIETHTTVGGDVIKSLLVTNQYDDYLRHCHDICLHHHERWNGTGYPDKLAGTDIPLSARLVALVDVYDALVTERCYKKAFTHEEAAKIIIDSSGSHFDPAIIDAFIEIQDQFRSYEAN